MQNCTRWVTAMGEVVLHLQRLKQQASPTWQKPWHGTDWSHSWSGSWYAVILSPCRILRSHDFANSHKLQVVIFLHYRNISNIKFKQIQSLLAKRITTNPHKTLTTLTVGLNGQCMGTHYPSHIKKKGIGYTVSCCSWRLWCCIWTQDNPWRTQTHSTSESLGTAEEDNTRFHSCQLTTGNRGYSGLRLTKTE